MQKHQQKNFSALDREKKREEQDDKTSEQNSRYNVKVENKNTRGKGRMYCRIQTRRRQSKQRWPSFWCRSFFQYRLWQYDSFSGLQRDLRGLHLFVKDLLVLTVPLLFLFLLAFPLGLVPVQLVLRLGVQLLWQERLQGKTEIKRI